MFESERERGISLGRLSRGRRDELVARLMFGRDWQQAKLAISMLMQAWGIGPEAAGDSDHE